MGGTVKAAAAALLVFDLVRGSLAPAAPLDYSSFTQTLRDKRVRSVESALAELPDDYWSYYVLMRDSRSSQPSSAAFPRVILSGLDGRFIVAFNGDPAAAGHDRLETMEVTGDGDAFELHQIVFPESGNTLAEPVFSEANPGQCLVCHQRSPRPNWDTYPNWLGAYGEQDDTLPAKERADYQAFVLQAPQLERYRRLQRPGVSPIAPFADKLADMDIDTRPNLFFTKLVARWNARRMALRLMRGAQGRDRFVAPALLFGCQSFPASAVPRVARVLGEPAEGLPKKLASLGPQAVVAELLHRSGIAPSDWSPVFAPPSPPARTGAEYAYFDGIFEIKDLVLYDLLRRLYVLYPEIAPISRMSGYYYDDSADPASRKQILLGTINSLGGVPEVGSGQGCSVLGQSLALPD